MKKVAIMSWSLNSGGAERAVANLSKDLTPFYEVYIILFDSRNIVYPYCGKILDVGILPAKTFLGKIVNFFRRYLKIKSLKRKYKFDAVVSFMPQVNTYNVLTREREKNIISIRNNMSDKGFRGLRKKMLIRNGRKADITVSLSDGVRDDLISNFSYEPSKVITIYNSCDAKWFYKKSENVERLISQFDFSRPTIVNVGRLTYQKGQWHLLRALSIIVETIPDCQLVVFGQGGMENDLKSYARKLGVEKNVWFMGFVECHHAFVEKCNVFAFSSLFEGLGNALLEALACEIPVVSSNCKYGPSEILSGDIVGERVQETSYGILVPPFEKKDFDENDDFEKNDYLFAEVLKDLLLNEEKSSFYKKQSALRMKDFSPMNIAKQWMKIIG